MSRAYLGLGANLGDRAAALQTAVDGLAAISGVVVVAVSGVYETEPVGGPAQPDYLNAVVALDTELAPRDLLGVARRLEQAARRVRGQRFGPRTLDVDVLLVDQLAVDEVDLVVPHPRMWERDFVLVPLADVAPELVPARPSAVGVRRSEVSLRVPESP